MSNVDEILKDRYYQPGESSWSDIAKRVSNFIGNTELEREIFYKLINDKVFIPASPILMNAGTDVPMLFACFGLTPNDSMDSIMKTMVTSAKIMKMGGGIGIDWSRLRPEGAPVGSTNGTSSGPVSFMSLFNEVIDVVKQAGKRRGAGISLLSIDHPDIPSFIHSKHTEGKFPNFNISVKITDDFMHHLDVPENKHRLDAIAKAMWDNGEPGILFIDNYLNSLPIVLSENENLVANPCGEQGLISNIETGAGECCCLGSMDMSKMESEEMLRDTVKWSVTFLDRCIDKAIYPSPEIEEMQKSSRRIGLGEMGWADYLIGCGIRYGSERCIKEITIMKKIIRDAAFKASAELAREADDTFPWNYRLKEESDFGFRRNMLLSSIAPTGSIAIFAGCSWGIEPITKLVYDRKNAIGEVTKKVHPLFLIELQKLDLDNIDEVIDEVYIKGTCQHITSLPQSFRDIFVCATDILPFQHIDVQAAFQSLTDTSISKTINCPASTSVSDIESMIHYGWSKGLKGFTVIREGSREVVYTHGSSGIVKKNTGPNYVRPIECPARRYIMKVGCGTMSIIVSGDPQTMEAIEVYLIPISGGGCAGHCAGEGMTISNSLQYGVPAEVLTKSLRKVVCKACIGKDGLDAKSCPDAIALALDKFTNGKGKLYTDPLPVPSVSDICPKCGAILTVIEGCISCTACNGYSRCS